MSSQSSPSNSDWSLSKGSSEAINYKYKDPYDYWSKVENLHNPKYTWQENYVYSVLPEKARIKIDKLPIDKQKQMLISGLKECEKRGIFSEEEINKCINEDIKRYDNLPDKVYSI